jgi:hypothetical protein
MRAQDRIKNIPINFRKLVPPSFMQQVLIIHV